MGGFFCMENTLAGNRQHRPSSSLFNGAMSLSGKFPIPKKIVCLQLRRANRPVFPLLF